MNIIDIIVYGLALFAFCIFIWGLLTFEHQDKKQKKLNEMQKQLDKISEM